MASSSMLKHRSTPSRGGGKPFTILRIGAPSDLSSKVWRRLTRSVKESAKETCHMTMLKEAISSSYSTMGFRKRSNKLELSLIHQCPFIAFPSLVVKQGTLKHTRPHNCKLFRNYALLQYPECWLPCVMLTR